MARSVSDSTDSTLGRKCVKISRITGVEVSKDLLWALLAGAVGLAILRDDSLDKAHSYWASYSERSSSG